MKWFTTLVFAISIFSGLQVAAQEEGTALLDKLISEKKLKEASQTLDLIIEKFKTAEQYDSLSDYPYYVGNIALLQYDNKTAKTKAESFYGNLKNLTNDPAVLRKACMSLASLYDLLGKPELGYKINEEALAYTSKIPNATGRLYGVIHSNLGTSALRNGNIKTAIEQYRLTLKRYDSDKATTQKDYYFGYSSMGTAMYYSSKIDSSIYYFEKAIDAVKKLDTSAINRYHRPSILYNNIAGLYSMEGNNDKALIAMKSSLSMIQKFIKSGAEDYKVSDSKRGYYQGIENYAGLYQTMGDYKKAHDLLVYAGKLKEQNLPSDSPEIFKSKVLLGNSNIQLHNYEKAAEQLDEAIALIKKSNGNFLTWNSDAHYGRAQLYEALEKPIEAAAYYKISEQLFEQAQSETYDENYLNFLRETSLFYAKNKNQEQAISNAKKAYNYVLSVQGKNSLPAIKETLNMAEVYNKLDSQEIALEYSTATIHIIDSIINSENKSAKATRFQLLKPKALLLKNQANLSLEENKSGTFLETIYNENQTAQNILEKQKLEIITPESIAILNNENNTIYDFSKKIALELYNKTKDSKYLDNILQLHEENLYNRIRSRLNGLKALKFSNVPEHILVKEDSLKKQLNATENGIENYIKTQEEWKRFISDIKKEYPKYFELRYGNKTATIPEIQEKIRLDQTVVRYLFIEDNLYVLTLTQNEYQFQKLSADALENSIKQFQNEAHNANKVTEAAHNLYSKLWQPIEKNIKTKRVTIIPDGILFNLNFEVLTPIKINTLEGFKTDCLLSKHAFSYNYSLQLFVDQQEEGVYEDNYIGFAPGFSSSLKEVYKKTQEDSIGLDFEYLRLLPQPFSLETVINAKKKLGGNIFTEDNASEENFISNAKNHKIIHIGTHAESNNIYPEKSRLVFAKSNDNDDNYLYNYEIYNTNLSSNLAVLTACETGKPSYQPGEGMLSLAHAFNYAGSESMLTSLWKIDEKSSAEITSYFYENLEKGHPKDIALQKAKLKYLETAEGRTLAPQYWAGLVLIGDTSPIEIKNHSYLWLILGGILLILLGIFILRKYLLKS